jgi:membrane peptidoglycan carboxypeptidase
MGTEIAIEFCKELGFPDFTDEGLSLALGGLQNGVSPAAMAGAYSMIANDGVYKTPIYYTKVTDSKGEIVFEATQEEKEVMTPQNAFIVKDILKQPVISGTATYCKIPNMDVAAKTGTTNEDFDRWLCGFTPYYTGACWYGYKENAKVKFSGNPAGYLWDEIMTRLHKDLELEPAKFEEPEGIIRRSTCKVSGKLSGPNCGENAYMEVYTADNVPKATCEGHGSITICNESKQMATPHCPDQVPVTGYIPEYEKNAIWVTERMVQTDITMTCPLHGGGAPIGGEPAPAPAPAPAPVQVAPAPAAPANPIAASTGAVQPTIQQRPVITPVQSQQRISIVPNNINVTPDSGSTQ